MEPNEVVLASGSLAWCDCGGQAEVCLMLSKVLVGHGYTVEIGRGLSGEWAASFCLMTLNYPLVIVALAFAQAFVHSRNQ